MVYKPTKEDFEAFPGAAVQKSYKPSIEDFNAIAPKTPGLLQKAGDFAEKYITKPVESARLPEIAGGLLQGTARGLESIANIPLGLAGKAIGRDIRVPYTDLQKYSKQDPLSRAAFFGGELGGALIPGVGAYNRVQKGLGAALSPSLGREALAGSISGAAVSGSEDERSRIAGAGLGAALPSAAGLSSKKIASNIINRQKSLDSLFNKKYDSIFSTLEKRNLHDNPLALPRQLRGEQGRELVKDLFSGNREFQKSINKFIKNPTFEAAHKAQSNMGKFEALLKRQAETAGRTGRPIASERFDRIKLANELRKKTRGSMQQFLLNNKQQDILREYGKTTAQYRELMSPYLNKSVARFTQGKTRPSKFIKELLQEEGFMKPGGAYKGISGLGTKRFLQDTGLSSIIDKLLQGAALTGGGLAAYKLGAPALGRTLKEAGS